MVSDGTAVALLAVAGVVILATLATACFAITLRRNHKRRQSLQFAHAMLTNAETIKEAIAAGYNFIECLAVVEAFYQAHPPSAVIDVPTLVTMVRKRRQLDGGVAAGINSVSSSVYTRLRHLVGIDLWAQAAWPMPSQMSVASPSQIELQQQQPVPLTPPQHLQLPSTPMMAYRGPPTEQAAGEQLVDCAVAAGFSRHLAHQCVAQVQREAPSMMPVERRAPPLRLLLLLERRRQEHAQFAAFERLSAIAEVAQPLLDKLSAQLGAPHAALLSALYAAAMSLPGTPRAMAGPPDFGGGGGGGGVVVVGGGGGGGGGGGSEARGGGGRRDEPGRLTARGGGGGGGGSGGGGGGSGFCGEPSEGEAEREDTVLAAYRRAEERWEQVRAFAPVMGEAQGPWQQQQLHRQLQAYLDASAVFAPSDVQHEAEALAREMERAPPSDPHLMPGGELWRQRLWRRLQRAAEAREELDACDALGALLGQNADVVLQAVFDAGHEARVVVALLVKYYDEHPQDAEAEVGVLPLWLEHALVSAAASQRREQAEMAVSAAAFSLSASVAFADAEHAPDYAGGGGGGGGGGMGEGAPGEAAWAEGLGTWWGLDSERSGAEGGAEEDESGADDEEATDDGDGTASTCTSEEGGGTDSGEDDLLGVHFPDGTTPRRVSWLGGPAINVAPGGAAAVNPGMPLLVLSPKGTDSGGASALSSHRSYVPGPDTYRRDGVVPFGTATPPGLGPPIPAARPPPSPPDSPPSPPAPPRSAYGAGVPVRAPPVGPVASVAPVASASAAVSSSTASAAPLPPLLTPMGRELVRASAPLLRHALVNGCPPGVLHAEVCDWLAGAAEADSVAGAPPSLPEHVVSALLERVRRWRLAPPTFATPPPPLWRTALDLNRAEVAHAWAEGAHWGASLFCLAAHYAENPHALARRQPISLLELARRLESLSQEALDWAAPPELTHPRGPNRTALAHAARRGYPPLLAVRTLHECYLADAGLRQAGAPVPRAELLARLRAKRQLHKVTAGAPT